MQNLEDDDANALHSSQLADACLGQMMLCEITNVQSETRGHFTIPAIPIARPSSTGTTSESQHSHVKLYDVTHATQTESAVAFASRAIAKQGSAVSAGPVITGGSLATGCSCQAISADGHPLPHSGPLQESFGVVFSCPSDRRGKMAPPVPITVADRRHLKVDTSPSLSANAPVSRSASPKPISLRHGTSAASGARDAVAQWPRLRDAAARDDDILHILTGESRAYPVLILHDTHATLIIDDTIVVTPRPPIEEPRARPPFRRQTLPATDPAWEQELSLDQIFEVLPILANGFRGGRDRYRSSDAE